MRFQAISKTKLKPNKNYSISGMISSEVLISDTSQTIKLGQFCIQTTRVPKYSIGDKIKVVGKLEERVTNKFYSQFWFVYPEIKLISLNPSEVNNGKGLTVSFLRAVSDFRKNFEKNIFRSLPSPQANLLSGIVLGSKTSFSHEFYNNLRQSGTLHIVVASGMNIIISAKIIFELLIRRFKRNMVIFVIFVYILIYTILAGLEPPIIRAGLMAFLAFSAQALGRAYWREWGLFLAIGIMLLFNPFLIFEAGFQLSAGATAGLIFLGPWVKERIDGFFQKLQQGLSLGSPRTVFAIFAIFKPDLTETLAAQAAVLPILLSTFGQFNFLSILPNVLIGFLVPALMRYGLLYILILQVIFPLARILGLLFWPALTYMVAVINFFGRIDVLTLPWKLPWWWGVFWWGGLWALFKSSKSSKSSKGDLRYR